MKPVRKTRAEIRALAAKLRRKHAANPEALRHINALLGSIGDTLSNDAIFADLSALKTSDSAFVEVFASNVKIPL